ncbi:hypothetical protein N7474_010015 [Penicillium riverlandense]|uniref:uncharacterized protein n=1 Tax=Penicillium riverlandense TaxID=1903569 RepID=UPI002546C92C|nr:uncharacterized protein N7474_010015 [Penicillium riverlandense]KAJ5808746.1 hypothetical protein N7474_010015 [Penicillium riverlandense]
MDQDTNSDDDSDILEGLPDTTHTYQWKGSQHFNNVIDQEYEWFQGDQTGEYSEWVAFTGLNETTYTHRFINSSDLRKSWKSYSPSQQTLLVKMSLPVHGHAIQKFHNKIISSLNNNALEDELKYYPDVKVKGQTKTKTPDNGLGPFERPPNVSNKWPTIVIEVGVSERPAKLQSDAEWWLTNSNGDVKIVFTMSINRKNPHITVMKWESEAEKNKCSVMQTVTTWKDNIGNVDTTRTSGTPLSIEFNKLFLRKPVSRTEHDILMDENDLRSLARSIWRVQEF